jgi:hypothetical protein
LNSFKKGSKKLRAVLCRDKKNVLEAVKLSFFEVAGINEIPNGDFADSLALWNLNCISNRQREFIFKFYHNRLGINTRTANFSDGSRWCSFCSIVGLNMGPFDDETFNHLFLNCPTVLKIHNEVAETLLTGVEIRPCHWFGSGCDNKFLTLFLIIIQYYIWEAKLNRMLPNTNYCVGEAIYSLDLAMKFNIVLRKHFSNMDCPLSRLWTRLALPRV